MASPNSTSKPGVEAAVFTTIGSAGNAVQSLLDAGFSTSEITVVCSDETKERYFREFEHQQPSGKNTPLAATVGGAVGAALFGLTTVAVGVATGGVPLIVAGGWGLWTGGVLGGFIGAMMTRGIEKETADYYDQAVVSGKILVAVEPKGQDVSARITQAARILSRVGAEPLPLRES